MDEKIGYFIVREIEGGADLEVLNDAGLLETREAAEEWIKREGEPGIDYWVCAPVSRGPRRRSLPYVDRTGEPTDEPFGPTGPTGSSFR